MTLLSSILARHGRRPVVNQTSSSGGRLRASILAGAESGVWSSSDTINQAPIISERLRSPTPPLPEDMETSSVYDSLTEVLRQQDCQAEHSRLSGHAESEYLHVTALEKICTRQIILYSKTSRNIVDLNMVDSATRIIWAIGRAVEKHVRDSIIAGIGRDKVLGNYLCRCGDTSVVYDGHNQEVLDTVCFTCRGGVFSYMESPIYDDEAGIIGACDLPLWNNERVQVVEIKSITGDAFTKLNKATGEHEFQAGAYNRLYSGMGYDVDPEAIVLYASKHYKFGSPYKEFPYNTQQDSIQRRLDRGWEVARRLKQDREADRVPGKICTSHECTTAKNCPVVSICFSGAYG